MVDAFEVFHGNAEGLDGRMLPCRDCRIADDVFDKNRVIIGQFGDGLFVRTLEHTIEFAAGGGFSEPDQPVRPRWGAAFYGEGDLPALIVCPPVADRLGAGTYRGDRHCYSGEELV